MIEDFIVVKRRPAIPTEAMLRASVVGADSIAAVIFARIALMVLHGLV